MVRTSSESRVSVRGVNPTRSRKSVETKRRSSGVGSTAAGVGDAGAVVSWCPHSAQNLSFADMAWPQLGQAAVVDVPHSEQNFAPSRNSTEQLVHRMPTNYLVMREGTPGEVSP